MKNVELFTFDMLESMAADTLTPDDSARMEKALRKLNSPHSSAGIVRVAKGETRLAVVWYTHARGTAGSCCRELSETLRGVGFDAADAFWGIISNPGKMGALAVLADFT